MKKLIALFGLLLATGFTATTVSAQEKGYWDDEELAVELVYRHANAKLEAPTSISQLGLADARNSVGFRVGYTHFFGRENGRGNLGIGVEGGATYSNNDAATLDSGNVAIGRGQFKVVYQDNRPDQKVRFGVKATGGIAREQFKQKALVTPSGAFAGLSAGANAWTFGGGPFVDFGEGRTRLRLGVEYYRSVYLKQNAYFPERTDKHNLEASVGIVF
jgi:hypothetical protein